MAESTCTCGWDHPDGNPTAALPEIVAATERDVRGDWPDVDDVTVGEVVDHVKAEFVRHHPGGVYLETYGLTGPLN